VLLTEGRINPLDGPLDQLMRRLPRDSWQYLKGPGRQVMDLRTTAEILLRFYEGLAEHGAGPPLETTPPGSTYPFTERLTDRPGPLDQDLMTAGLSPTTAWCLLWKGRRKQFTRRACWQCLARPTLMR
jgi:hypothetical protein